MTIRRRTRLSVVFVVSLLFVAAPFTTPRLAPFRYGTLAAAEKQPRKAAPGIPSKAQKGAATAVAVPLRDMTIDGKLDDWPKNLVKHYLLNGLKPNPGHGVGAYDVEKLSQVDLTANPDLSVYFMVGYEPNINLEYDVVYVAMVVRDDVNHVRFTGVEFTDAAEVYIDGDHGERTIGPAAGVRARQLPAQQYVAVAGDGPAYGSADGNPAFYEGGIEETKTRMAYHREGDTTVYEWAIQAFDRFPDQPTSLAPGKRIGFDVAVSDVDAEGEKPRWICWGPDGVTKHFNAQQMGDLIMGRDD